jgi:hypothetical protein
MSDLRGPMTRVETERAREASSTPPPSATREVVVPRRNPARRTSLREHLVPGSAEQNVPEQNVPHFSTPRNHGENWTIRTQTAT